MLIFQYYIFCNNNLWQINSLFLLFFFIIPFPSHPCVRIYRVLSCLKSKGPRSNSFFLLLNPSLSVLSSYQMQLSWMYSALLGAVSIKLGLILHIIGHLIWCFLFLCIFFIRFCSDFFCFKRWRSKFANYRSI